MRVYSVAIATRHCTGGWSMDPRWIVRSFFIDQFLSLRLQHGHAVWNVRLRRRRDVASSLRSLATKYAVTVPRTTFGGSSSIRLSRPALTAFKNDLIAVNLPFTLRFALAADASCSFSRSRYTLTLLCILDRIAARKGQPRFCYARDKRKSQTPPTTKRISVIVWQHVSLYVWLFLFNCFCVRSVSLLCILVTRTCYFPSKV